MAITFHPCTALKSTALARANPMVIVPMPGTTRVECRAWAAMLACTPNSPHTLPAFHGSVTAHSWKRYNPLLLRAPPHLHANAAAHRSFARHGSSTSAAAHRSSTRSPLAAPPLHSSTCAIGNYAFCRRALAVAILVMIPCLGEQHAGALIGTCPCRCLDTMALQRHGTTSKRACSAPLTIYTCTKRPCAFGATSQAGGGPGRKALPHQTRLPQWHPAIGLSMGAAPARAALAAGKRLPPSGLDCSDQCHRCMSPHAAHASGKVPWPETHCSADSALAVASPPRTAGHFRRRRCPSVARATFAPPRALFFSPCRFSPRPRASAACSTPARRVDAAHGANTAATSPSAPVSISCFPSTLPLPSHSYLSPQQFPSLPHRKNARRSKQSRRRACSRGQPSPLLPRPNRGSHELPHPPPPLLDPFLTLFLHRSRRRSSPEKTELSAAARARAQLATLLLRFALTRWCSPATSPTLSDPDVAAATVVAEHYSGHPRPRDLAQTNHGEPLFISPHFPGPVSPPFGRLYDLVPAAEEIAQESEVNVVHVDPSPEQEYRFEPEGKPRSIT
nr:unnamed protein product [Digitaria exilis]